jgi:hypothetical protein
VNSIDSPVDAAVRTDASFEQHHRRTALPALVRHCSTFVLDCHPFLAFIAVFCGCAVLAGKRTQHCLDMLAVLATRVRPNYRAATDGMLGVAGDYFAGLAGEYTRNPLSIRTITSGA